MTQEASMSLRARSIVALLAAGAAAPALAQVSLPIGGYTQNFDSMTATGTARPAGWTTWSLAGDNSTFTTNIPESAVSGGSQQTGALGVFTQNVAAPTNGSNNNAGVNFGFSTNPSDRGLGLAPTTVAAGVSQLQLRNDTGAALSRLTVTFDLETVTTFSTSAPNELPGYFFFYSLGGATGAFTAVPALRANPGLTPAVASFITVTGDIELATPLAAGSVITLRWVDDNADQTSPDRPQYALDNVSVIPTPGPAALLGMGALIAGRRRRA
jgi:hypothetical protein